MLHSALFVLLIAPLACFAQNSAPNPQAKPATVTPAPAVAPPIPAQVLNAEASIAKSDWKSAQAVLDAWLVSHPADYRALFDAGYVADAQNRMDDAAALYRRAIDANHQSFEAHLSLGLLLARQNKPKDARAELVLATTLDPGDAGPALKARAWRALAQIDRTTDPIEASNDLLEALKLTTGNSSRHAAGRQSRRTVRRIRRCRNSLPPHSRHRPRLRSRQLRAGPNPDRPQTIPEAETLLRAALAKSPDDPALTAQLATVLGRAGQGRSAPAASKAPRRPSQ